MSLLLDALIALSITWSIERAEAPKAPPPEKAMAAEYGKARKLFVIRGKVCDTSARCLILKPSAANKVLK